MLRREGYDGDLTMISADDSPPCDRPNLSKDFLAGKAQDDWIPLRPPEFYAERRIDLVLNARVSRWTCSNARGSRRRRAIRLRSAADCDRRRTRSPADSGRDDAQIRYLRTFADSRAIVAKAASAKRVVVVGASFIGLEVAASLRARGMT